MTNPQTTLKYPVSKAVEEKMLLTRNLALFDMIKEHPEKSVVEVVLEGRANAKN